MEDTADQRVGRKQRLLYILAPLFLLIVCLGTINLTPALILVAGADQAAPVATAALATITPVENAITTPSSRFKQEPGAAPTLLPTPTPTMAPAPLGAEIQLLGPPSGSTFRIGDTLSFYWQWPAPLAEDQSLAVYLLVQNQEYLLGRLGEPNVGQSYRLHVPIDDSMGATGKAQWQVRLESNHARQWLAASEIRPLALLVATESIP